MPFGAFHPSVWDFTALIQINIVFTFDLSGLIFFLSRFKCVIISFVTHCYMDEVIMKEQK